MGDAAVLATAIRIHRAVETDIRGLVAADDGLGRFLTDAGGEGQRPRLFVPAVVLDLAAGRGEAIVRIAGGATAAWRTLGLGHVRASCCIFVQYKAWAIRASGGGRLGGRSGRPAANRRPTVPKSGS